jgi:isopenicillin-N N-acyltransferase-like protein
VLRSRMTLNRLLQIACTSLVFATLIFAGYQFVSAETIARCGEGWLEIVDQYTVLHVRGTPYEMGYQHGALLKKHVRENMGFLMAELSSPTLVKLGSFKVNPRSVIRGICEFQRKHIPPSYYEELAGLAAGAEIDEDDIRIGNFLPELMHCSGFSTMNSATKDGTLYHGRVLDYAIDWRLQEHAVLMVAEPTGGIPFVNVTYAGFIGSVTGMNARHVSIGEMGGGGYGHWNGVPMAVLVRQVLGSAENLLEAVTLFRDQPRTCQYFFVIADGKTNQAVGMEASWNRFELIQPGSTNDLLPTPVKDCVLLSAGDRYRQLVRRVEQGHGDFTAESARRLMDRPVSMNSNLHNVLFEPASLRLWVANATADLQPAADQNYQEFSLGELLARHPESGACEIPLLKTASP